MAKENYKQKKDTCFVIMPFGGWFDNYYVDIYKPAIVNAGLEPKRADDIYRPSSIVQDIWDLTKEAKIVLADLTGKNANVLYELGLAHSLAKPAILVTNSMDDVPFDLRALRVIEFDKNASNWGDLLKGKIEIAIKETLESPIKSVLPAFLDTDDIKKTQITITEKDFLELKRELEFLRNEIRQSKVLPKKASLDYTKLIVEIAHMLNLEMSVDEIQIELIERGWESKFGYDELQKIIKSVYLNPPPGIL